MLFRSFRDQVPRQVDVNGRKRWIIGGDIDLGGAGAASVVGPEGDKIYGIGWL